jgi:hypothetical protein
MVLYGGIYGLAVDPKKVVDILNCKAPTNVRGIKSLLEWPDIIGDSLKVFKDCETNDRFTSKQS